LPAALPLLRIFQSVIVHTTIPLLIENEARRHLAQSDNKNIWDMTK
jgi:hypothetical protein